MLHQHCDPTALRGGRENKGPGIGKLASDYLGLRFVKLLVFQLRAPHSPLLRITVV